VSTGCVACPSAASIPVNLEEWLSWVRNATSPSPGLNYRRDGFASLTGPQFLNADYGAMAQRTPATTSLLPRPRRIRRVSRSIVEGPDRPDQGGRPASFVRRAYGHIQTCL